jgi:predicted nucleic acid-binding protein
VTLRLFSDHARVGIDSNVLIYLLEGSGEMADAAGALLDAIAAGQGHGVLATLAIAEVGGGPARWGDAAMVERYADELASLDGVVTIPLDRAIAVDAAILRADGPLSLADSIHLATARAGNASAFVTNDRRILPLPGLQIVYLDELDGPTDPA